VAAPLQVPFFRAANARLLAEIEARLTGHVFPPEEHILWKVRARLASVSHIARFRGGGVDATCGFAPPGTQHTHTRTKVAPFNDAAQPAAIDATARRAPALGGCAAPRGAVCACRKETRRVATASHGISRAVPPRHASSNDAAHTELAPSQLRVTGTGGARSPRTCCATSPAGWPRATAA
jgi:hypothetical protein